MEGEIKIINRHGYIETYDSKFIYERNLALCNNINPKLELDLSLLLNNIIKEIELAFDKGKRLFKTSEIDSISSKCCEELSFFNSDYRELCTRIEISDCQKKSPKTFNEFIRELKQYEIGSKTVCFFSDEFCANFLTNGNEIENMIKRKRDFNFSYRGWKLIKSYLLPLESIQYLWMRICICICKTDLKRIKETYKLLSTFKYTHSSPILYNGGLGQEIKKGKEIISNNPSLFSCYLTCIKSDSLEGIYDSSKEIGLLSRGGGGIGINLSLLRPTGSIICGNGGQAKGIIPIMKKYEKEIEYVEQSGGRRKGAIVFYLDIWHMDIIDFLNTKLTEIGNKKKKIKKGNIGIMIPDLFYERVIKNEKWTLLDPSTIKPIEGYDNLTKTFGKIFEKWYCSLENNKFVKKKEINAMDLMRLIIDAQEHSGEPYPEFKDTINYKSMQQILNSPFQKNVIRTSNLCTEIVQYCSEDKVASCNLSTIVLIHFINDDFKFEKEKFIKTVRIMVRNMDDIISNSSYTSKEVFENAIYQRSLAIGVCGLAECFFKIGIPFESEEAFQLNEEIFETLYYAALLESLQLSKERGPCPLYYEGIPISKGFLQFDFWNVKPKRYDWDDLKEEIKKYGIRNSLLIGQMPTVSTSVIVDTTSSIEPITSNIYIQQTSTCSVMEINKYLIRDLKKLNLFNQNVFFDIINEGGSIQNIDYIPTNIKNIYKCAHEIDQTIIIKMAVSRGPFIDQSQSLNLFIPEINSQNKEEISQLILKYHLLSWKIGLKGLYYIHQKKLYFNDKPKLLSSEEEDKLCILGNNEDGKICLGCST